MECFINTSLEYLTIAKGGLILNTIGAIILTIASTQTLNVLTKFVDTIKDAYGTLGQGSAVPRVKEIAKEFDQIKSKSTLTNRVGYAFLIIGFIIQLF